MNMILWKESLNIDGQQLQQNINKMINYLSPHTIEHKKTTSYGVGIPDPCLGQTQQCDRVKPVNGIQPLSDNWISNCNIDINKQ